MNDLKGLREEVITEDLGDREWWRSLVEAAIGIKDMENVDIHTSKWGEREAAWIRSPNFITFILGW